LVNFGSHPKIEYERIIRWMPLPKVRIWPRIPRIRIHWIPHSFDSIYSWFKKRSVVLAEIRFPEWSDQITVAQGSNKIESPDGCNGNEHTVACCTSGLTTNSTNDTNKNKMNPTFVWFELFVVEKKEHRLMENQFSLHDGQWLDHG
jgi:hypothetical protein